MTLFQSLQNAYQRFAAHRMFAHWSAIYEEEVTENAYSAADAVAAATARHMGMDMANEPLIADIGIGTGLLAQQIFDSMPCRITGLDFAQDMMAQAAARDITELLIKCDVGRDHWPLLDHSYDCVVAAGLFEYLTETMVRHFCAEALRCLKPSGLLVFTYLPLQSGDKKTSLWRGHSGSYLVCKNAAEEMPKILEGFEIVEHSQPFKGCVFTDGSSYDYRLIVARKK